MIHQTADGVFLQPKGEWFSAVCTCGYTNGPFPDPETMVDDLMAHAASYELEKLGSEMRKSMARWQAARDGEPSARESIAARLEMLDAVIATINKRLTT